MMKKRQVKAGEWFCNYSRTRAGDHGGDKERKKRRRSLAHGVKCDKRKKKKNRGYERQKDRAKMDNQ